MPKVAWADTATDWVELLRAAEPLGEGKDLKVHLTELRTALQRVQELQDVPVSLSGGPVPVRKHR